jgi:LuxR family maltose regulon positive regulatory protein
VEDRPTPAVSLVEPLSEREQEVLRLLAAGRSNQEIADALYVTVGTVKTHTHRIYAKLGVRGRTEAIARGREAGLLP